MAAQVTLLSSQEQTMSRWSHGIVVKYTDINTVAATSVAIPVIPYVKGMMVKGGQFVLVTPFDGGSTSALALDVGYNGATADDADAFLDNYELHADATEVLGGDANGAAFATLRTGFVAVEAGNIEVLLTATGANLTALTAGEVRIYLDVVTPPNL